MACAIHIGKVPEDITMKIANVDPVQYQESHKRLSEKLKLKLLQVAGSVFAGFPNDRRNVALQQSQSPSASSSAASISGTPAASGRKRSREEDEAYILSQLG